MQKIVSANADALSRKAADFIVAAVKQTLSKQKRFTIALSGGSTPKKLFKLLSSEEYKDQIDWKHLHFFWGDERFVPFSDEKNNARMAFEELLDKVEVDRKNIHVMNTDLSPEESETAYENLLHGYFDNTTTSFDLVMLGLGDNAHTLSLFPGYPIIHEKKKWVDTFFLKEQDMYRISLTAPIVNRAAAIIFLVSGADKAIAVEQILEGPKDADKYPAQVIAPAVWFLDKPAAALLDSKKL